jgi:hypothetical protein
VGKNALALAIWEGSKGTTSRRAITGGEGGMSIDSISTGAGQAMRWQPGLGRTAEADTEGRGVGNSGRSEKERMGRAKAEWERAARGKCNSGQGGQ